MRKKRPTDKNRHLIEKQNQLVKKMKRCLTVLRDQGLSYRITSCTTFLVGVWWRVFNKTKNAPTYS